MGAVGAAVAGSAVSAGIGALSSRGGGGSGGSQTTSTSTAPWGPQQPYLQNAFQAAQSIFNNRMGAGPYGGDLYAGSNPTIDTAVANGGEWNNGGGNVLPHITAITSGQLQAAAPTFVNNAAGMASSGAGSPMAAILAGYASGATPTSSSNAPLSSALNNAAVAGANSLGDFTSGQRAVMNNALTDPTTGLISNATSYMNASPVQDAVNSTNAMIDQTLHEQTVPGLNRQAAMGGGLNSSRAGMAEAMANEGAAIAKGNADSAILNNAWNSGLSTAANERNAGLTTGLDAANGGLAGNAAIAQGQQNTQLGQSEFDTTARIGAAGAGANYDLANANLRLGANGQLGTAAGLGINGATAAEGQAASNLATGAAAGLTAQQMAQAGLNNSFGQWQLQNGYQQGVLNDYFNIIGKQFGSSSDGTTSANLPSNPIGGALGGLALGQGLFGQGGLLNGVFGGGTTYYNGQPSLDQAGLYSSPIGPNMNGSYYGGSSPIANAFYGLTGGG